MREKFLRNIVVHIAGPQAEPIVELLIDKENVNEFAISKKLNLTINQTRNILYKLSDEGLVGFIRKKDKKNGGWYTYFWTLDSEKALSTLAEKIEHEILHLEINLASKMTKQFYYCPNCDIEMSEEEALAHNFTCPECGEVFLSKDNEKEVGEIKQNIESLRKDLSDVNSEIKAILDKKEASKERKRKREAKKKSKKKPSKKVAKVKKTPAKKVKKAVAKKVKKTAPKKVKKAVKKTSKKKTVKTKKKSSSKKSRKLSLHL